MALDTVFAATALLSFAFTLFVAGLFGAKFGQGRSRGIGILIALVAVLVAGVFMALTWHIVPGIEPIFDDRLVSQSIIAVLAATLGAIVAIVTFVASVMKA